MVVLPVPGHLCRECGLCCRFSDPSVLTPWAVRPGADTLPPPFRPPKPLALIPGAGRMDLPVLVCDALSSDSYRCAFWGSHPADCRLYPLVLVYRDGGFLLALDPDCPFSAREPHSFFLDWATRFREEEWKRLPRAAVPVLSELARSEDRPHYRPVLPLPEPEGPMPS
ncbi:MAG: YkgJ family cysteine cluster protein [Nitrospiraceae bacterium]|nr:YkgJ family cysteine cluster protein [Nitrospiraceae bacterium]